MSVVSPIMETSTKGKLMDYRVKIWNRNNGMIVDSVDFYNLKNAQRYYRSVGFGEGYWADLEQLFEGYSVTISSTV